MNRLKIKNVMTMVAIAAATIISCVPKDGDTGPVGPIGAEGPPGADGSIGRDGEDGVDGGSQVTSKTYTVTGDDLVLDANTAILTDTISEPLITKDVVDNGAIQVFISDSPALSGATWHALTYRIIGNINGTPQFINFTYSYAEDNLYLKVQSELAAPFSFPSTTTYFYKLVIIPDILRKKGIDYNDLSLEQIEMIHEVKELDELGLEVYK